MKPPAAVGSRLPTVVSDPILACLAADPADRPTPAALADVVQPLVERLPRPVLAGLRQKLL